MGNDYYRILVDTLFPPVTLYPIVKTPDLLRPKSDPNGLYSVLTYKYTYSRDNTYNPAGKLNSVDYRQYLQLGNQQIKNLVRTIVATGDTNDQKAEKILKWVTENITYTSDTDQYHLGEYWAKPTETLKSRRGDCEDGAFLIQSMALAAGIPVDRLRTYGGLVKAGTAAPLGGHAWTIYKRETDNQWVDLDWCVVPTRYTFVNTLKGKKRFSELREGDRLPALDEHTGKIEITAIVKIGNREVNEVYRLYLEGIKNPILCTPEHPWFINGRWEKTQEIVEGDEIYFTSPKSFTNLFNPLRKSQYLRTSLRQSNCNVFTLPEVRKKLSKNNAMKDPELVKRVYSKRLKKGYKSLPEIRLEEVFCKLNLPVRYVGDGSFWVRGKNPDFKVSGEKKVIEVTQYGYLKRDENWAAKRIAHFKRYGFKCLVIFYDKRCDHMVGLTECGITSFVMNGKKVLSIEKIVPKYNQKKVWNLHCEPYNNYFINGLLTHNCYYPDSTSVASKETFKVQDEYIDAYWWMNAFGTYDEYGKWGINIYA